MTFISPSPQEEASQASSRWILCSYRNQTNRMVIVRVKGNDSFFLERVVFPFELLTFRCPKDGEVEVIVRTAEGKEYCERIAPNQLLALEAGFEPLSNWRPQRSLRSVSVRSNASTTCREDL